MANQKNTVGSVASVTYIPIRESSLKQRTEKQLSTDWSAGEAASPVDFPTSVSTSRTAGGSADVDRRKWLTTSETAEYLRTSVGAIHNKVYRGQLARQRLGRKLLFKKSELDRLIESSRPGGQYEY